VVTVDLKTTKVLGYRKGGLGKGGGAPALTKRPPFVLEFFFKIEVPGT